MRAIFDDYRGSTHECTGPYFTVAVSSSARIRAKSPCSGVYAAPHEIDRPPMLGLVVMQAAERSFSLGRYALHDEIGAGGMATVHLGRLLGPIGFARTVAIKRLHPQFAKDRDFVSMFLDEARLAARISHPNVVTTLDVISTDDEVFLVLEYVRGESLSRLLREQSEPLAPAMAATIMAGVLHGLHAAHEAKSEHGVPLDIVHRDVSPQNILVGVDGVARLLDFGVAKAFGRLQTTRNGQIKGKLAYMAPEQTRGVAARASDVYAVSVVLWEALTGQRLFGGENDGEILRRVLEGQVVAPGELVPGVPEVLDAVVLRGLNPEPAERFQTAREMAMALEDAVPLVAASRIGNWVESAATRWLAGARPSGVANRERSDAPAATFFARGERGAPGRGDACRRRAAHEALDRFISCSPSSARAAPSRQGRRNARDVARPAADPHLAGKAPSRDAARCYTRADPRHRAIRSVRTRPEPSFAFGSGRRDRGIVDSARSRTCPLRRTRSARA